MLDSSAAEVDQHSLLRAVWDGAADALALSDPAGRVVLANPAYYRLFGYTPEDVIGQSFALIFPEHERSAAEAAYRAVFDDPAGSEAFEAVVRRKDGSERVVEARIDFVVEGGRRTAMVNTIRDVTERARLIAAERAARARAEDLDRQKEEVIAAVVHDVRSPLTAARVYAEVLGRRAALGGDDVDPAVAGIAAGVNRALSLLDELADVDQARSGDPMLLRRATVDLVVLAREAVADHAAAADHRLRVEAECDSVCGAWDARRLRRALDNLLGNAVKYSPVGSEIVVRVAEEVDSSRRWAVLSVRDQGIGVPADEQARVFEPFHRAPNAAHVAGTGIGLTSVRRIAEAHGGTVSLESREGLGTTVTLRLPLEG